MSIATATMIVDDEEDIRMLLRSVIANANNGLSVACEATDGSEAVTKWREYRPDVVVMDQRMPNLTGLEAAEQILDEHPGQKIVLFSAYLDDALRTKARDLGIRACLSKDEMAALPRTLWALAG